MLVPFLSSPGCSLSLGCPLCSLFFSLFFSLLGGSLRALIRLKPQTSQEHRSFIYHPGRVLSLDCACFFFITACLALSRCVDISLCLPLLLFCFHHLKCIPLLHHSLSPCFRSLKGRVFTGLIRGDVRSQSPSSCYFQLQSRI